eukprot:jgi/Bigna1/70748/fgenesh1_pg.13_\
MQTGSSLGLLVIAAIYFGGLCGCVFQILRLMAIDRMISRIGLAHVFMAFTALLRVVETCEYALHPSTFLQSDSALLARVMLVVFMTLMEAIVAFEWAKAAEKVRLNRRPICCERFFAPANAGVTAALLLIFVVSFFEDGITPLNRSTALVWTSVLHVVPRKNDRSALAFFLSLSMPPEAPTYLRSIHTPQLPGCLFTTTAVIVALTCIMRAGVSFAQSLIDNKPIVVMFYVIDAAMIVWIIAAFNAIVVENCGPAPPEEEIYSELNQREAEDFDTYYETAIVEEDEESKGGEKGTTIIQDF